MNKPVKVLSLVSYKFLPPNMGGQKGIAFFNRYLSKHVQLSCVTIQDNTDNQNEGYPIKNILPNDQLRYINPFLFFTLRRVIREEKITHLIIEHPYFGWLGMLLKWFCKVKLIVHSHNIEASRFKSMGKSWWPILWQYEKMTHQNADHNFFIQDNDRQYAIDHFKLNPALCTTITYGFELATAPSSEEKITAKKTICNLHGIAERDKILLFNGTLGYKPNLDALNIILHNINPNLLVEPNFNYTIIICGNKLPLAYNGLSNFKNKNIVYAGFVDDINLYFKGADLFINPVIDGGGIKTKVVEALGYNLSVISTASGAIGIPQTITGNKMQLIADGDWAFFCKLIVSMNTTENIPQEYFNHFYWGKIAEKAASALNQIQ